MHKRILAKALFIKYFPGRDNLKALCLLKKVMKTAFNIGRKPICEKADRECGELSHDGGGMS
jgi:hypothetical protein